MIKKTHANAITQSGGYGADQLFGGAGDDSLAGGYGNDMLLGLGGKDTLLGGQNDDFLFGAEGDDLLNGGTGRDALYGGEGKDRLLGGDGDDTVFMTSSAEATGDAIDGGDGIDTLSVTFTNETAPIVFTAADPLQQVSFNGLFSMRGIEAFNIIAGKGADSVTGYRLSDYLDGGLGSDTLKGGAGDDFLQGGAGDDRLFGDQDDDLVQAGAGADAVAGGSGNDILFSDGADDNGVEIDKLSGGSGDDYVFIGMKDIGDGGDGVDRLHLDFSASAVAENFIFGASNNFASGGQAKNFETLEFDGGTGKDNVTGGSLADLLNGNGGDDLLLGGKGADVIDGGNGNDLIRGGDDGDILTDSAGADKLYGDDGDDIFLTDSTNASRDVFVGGNGIDSVFFSDEAGYSAYLDLTDPTRNDGLAKGDTFGAIEVFHGTALDDFMYGSTGADSFYGEDGDDVLDGRAGDDRLAGGGGSNTLTGGAGKDVFVLGASSDDGGGFGSYWKGDVVTDLKQGEDRIEIALADFGLSGAGDFKLVVGANPVAANANATFLFDTATDRLWFDEDGNGGDHEAMLVATFENDVTLKASDFLLV